MTAATTFNFLNSVTNAKPFDVCTHLLDDAYDLVAWDHGVHAVFPLIARLVQVGVADAAVFDVEQDIVCARLAALYLKRSKWLCC